MEAVVHAAFRILALALVALVGLFSSPASATCPTSETIIEELTCSSVVSGTIDASTASSLGGSCSSGDCYSCGSPYAPLNQNQYEDVYSFTCQATGSVTLNISGLDCDLDIYVLDSTCDPYGGCETGSTEAGRSDDSVTFSCVAGSTYYVVLEGYGFGLSSGTGRCRTGDGEYTLDFDISAGTGCPEDCTDGTDNDFDGDIDCDDSDCTGDPACGCDADGDGYDDTACGGTDCDDTDPTIYPGATEVCDGVDNDCDGSVDEGVTTTYYADGDADGYGDASVSTDDCSAPSGYVADDSDCDDSDPAVNPGEAEVCDGVDNDCDTLIDEGVTSTFYADGDGDGYGDVAASTEDCSAPSGYVADGTDCDDTDAGVNPGATEVCDGVDNDCDTLVDEGVTSTYYADSDGDGYGDLATSTEDCSTPSGYVTDSSDCDDTDSTVNPGATEVCDGVDNDCDGSVDEGVTSTYYADSDGDGYGDAAASSDACSTPSGYVSDSTDCDDTDAAVNPGATEVCDSIDNDCDGDVDEGLGSTYYADADGDGYGDAGSSLEDCSTPSGYVTDDTDCDDSDPAVNPAATEVCDEVDNDCDGDIDEGLTSTFYADADGDGYGDAGSTEDACSEPTGFTTDDTDCDDSEPTVNPGATEICDGLDNDCDGTVDEGVTSTFYADADLDGYGDATSSTEDCTEPSGYVTDDTDCDDTDPDVYPGAPEEPYDGVDQDCDGSDICDVDGDGYDFDGGVCGGTDCDDEDAGIGPGATESADGVDEDCDGTVDEETEWYDDDGDGYTEAGGDCDDDDATVSPAAVEDCDGVDDDCDGVIDEETDCYDDDGDGYTEDDGDCNDADADVSPDAAEVDGDGVDNDCDGSVDGGTYDPDSDGYTTDGGDCEPEDGDSYPGAPEVADGVDNDCDGEVDEGTEAYDDDGDGYTELEGDCNDDDAEMYPGAPEVDDGQDDDCDGIVDNGLETSDDDGDGYTELDGDCDDSDPEVNPSASERENGYDDDCDGLVDEQDADADLDGVTVDEGDCDDNDPWASPGMVEMCDGVDNDCDGAVDEGCDPEGKVEDPNAQCGCGAAPLGLPLVPLVVSMVTVIRRRRNA